MKPGNTTVRYLSATWGSNEKKSTYKQLESNSRRKGPAWRRRRRRSCRPGKYGHPKTARIRKVKLGWSQRPWSGLQDRGMCVGHCCRVWVRFRDEVSKDLLDDNGPMIWVKTRVDEALNLPDVRNNVGDVCRWHPRPVATKYEDVDYHVGWIDGEVTVGGKDIVKRARSTLMMLANEYQLCWWCWQTSTNDVGKWMFQRQRIFGCKGE